MEHNKSFLEWFNKPEVSGYRAARFYDDIEINLEDLDKLEKSMVQWLHEAYTQGVTDGSQ